MAVTDRKKVVIGLSGGVDSSVAAYLLKEQGYDVTGVILRMWGNEPDSPDVCDAGDIAARLGIAFHAIDCSQAFEKNVRKPFEYDYLSGLTPNPCVRCNKEVKWERLTAFADEIGAAYVATGHYARISKLENGRMTLNMASMAAKDQTYMLYRLSQDDLLRTLMPLGEYSKDEVRRIAGEIGLKVAEKKDSQEICFIPDGDYAGYIAANTDGALPPPGDFTDEKGNVLGQHKGIINYTIGQRKGLGIALGRRMFVKEIDALSNRVVLSDDSSLYKSRILCRDLNFMAIEDIKPGETIRACVKIRYQHKPAPAGITRADGERVLVSFDEPVRAPAPGQSAVFYDENMRVIGGGIIDLFEKSVEIGLLQC